MYSYLGPIESSISKTALFVSKTSIEYWEIDDFQVCVLQMILEKDNFSSVGKGRCINGD